MADSQDTVSEGVAAVLAEDQQTVGIDSITTADVDYEEEVDNVQVRHNSRRKRPRADFPWSYTHDWTSGDPVRFLRDRRQCGCGMQQVVFTSNKSSGLESALA